MTVAKREAADRARAILADRLAAARTAKAAGTKVIGLIGSGIPPEIVRAAGAFAVRLAAEAADHDRDAAPMEIEHEAEIRSLFRQATSGGFAVCDAIVIASTADGYRYLFQYLTEMARTAQGSPLPPIWLYDVLFGPEAPVRAYSRSVATAFAERLAALSGRGFDADALASAIAEANPVRAALAELPPLRATGAISGPDAIALIGAGGFIAPEEHRALIDAAVAEATGHGGAARPRLLLATAVPLYHDRVHQAACEAGADIVAEDDGWGSRAGGPAIVPGDDPLGALLEHHRLHSVSPRQVGGDRERWLRAAMAGGAGPIDGMIFHMPPDDQSYGWRYPGLAAHATALGLPSLMLRDDALTANGQAAIVSHVCAFAASLAGAGA